MQDWFLSLVSPGAKAHGSVMGIFISTLRGTELLFCIDSLVFFVLVCSFLSFFFMEDSLASFRSYLLFLFLI